MNGVTQVSIFVLLHVDIQFSQCLLLKRLSCPHCLVLELLPKIIQPHTQESLLLTLYFVPLVYFVPSVFILVSHCFDYFVIFKSGSVMLPSLFCSPKIVLVIQGPLRLYMNLRILFPIFSNNGTGVLIVIALNL